MGKHRKPSAIREAEGNRSKREIPENEFSPPVVKPEELKPSRHLTKDAKKEFKKISKKLSDLGVLAEVDQTALEIYCETYARMLQAKRDFLNPDKGRGEIIVTTTFGNPIPNPFLSAWRTEERMLISVLARFGMSPSDRAGLIIEKQKSGEENPWEIMHKARAKIKEQNQERAKKAIK